MDTSSRVYKAKVEVNIKELMFLFNRALNCLDPSLWPEWVKDIVNNYNYGKEAILDTDKCEILFTRETKI